MSVQVSIPTALRKLADGKDEVAVEGATVREAIEGIRASWPQLAEQLVDESGKLRRFVILYVNDEDIRFADGIDTALEDGDELTIVPAIAGGAGTRA